MLKAAVGAQCARMQEQSHHSVLLRGRHVRHVAMHAEQPVALQERAMKLFCPPQKRMVTITYGDRTNFELMRQYGFVVPGNVADQIYVGHAPKRPADTTRLCQLLAPDWEVAAKRCSLMLD